MAEVTGFGLYENILPPVTPAAAKTEESDTNNTIKAAAKETNLFSNVSALVKNNNRLP
jgi:hypothetical protein